MDARGELKDSTMSINTKTKLVPALDKNHNVGPIEMEHDAIYVCESSDGDDIGKCPGILLAVIPLAALPESTLMNPVDLSHRPDSTVFLETRLRAAANGGLDTSWGRSSLKIARQNGNELPYRSCGDLRFYHNGRHRIQALRQQGWTYAVFLVQGEEALAIVEYMQAVLYLVHADIILRPQGFRAADPNIKSIDPSTLPRWLPHPHSLKLAISVELPRPGWWAQLCRLLIGGAQR